MLTGSLIISPIHARHFLREALAVRSSSSEAETVSPMSLTGLDTASLLPGDTATAGASASAFSSPDWAPTVGAGRRAMARRSFFPAQAPNTSGDLALMLAASPVRESRCEGTSVEQGTVPSRGTGRLGRLERQPTSSPVTGNMSSCGTANDGRLGETPKPNTRGQTGSCASQRPKPEPCQPEGISEKRRAKSGRKPSLSSPQEHPWSPNSDPPPMCDEENPSFGRNPNFEDLT